MAQKYIVVRLRHKEARQKLKALSALSGETMSKAITRLIEAAYEKEVKEELAK